MLSVILNGDGSAGFSSHAGFANRGPCRCRGRGHSLHGATGKSSTRQGPTRRSRSKGEGCGSSEPHKHSGLTKVDQWLSWLSLLGLRTFTSWLAKRASGAWYGLPSFRLEAGSASGSGVYSCATVPGASEPARIGCSRRAWSRYLEHAEHATHLDRAERPLAGHHGRSVI